MAKLFNRAKMDTSTTGSGTITLGSAVDGYQSFADAGVADSDVVQYVIEDGTSWEIGTGTYSATGTSLTRTPSESSNAGAAISLTGAAEVFISAIHSDFERLQNAGTTKVEATSTGATVTGNLAVTGTVDGRDIASDGSKLDGIEAGATADQTKADIDALGINADQVDGLEASQFLRSDANNSYIQSEGLSTSWGVTNGTSTGALNAVMGTSNGATWLISGTSGGTFRGGWQVLDGGGSSRFYLGSNYYSLSGSTGSIWHSGNDGSGSGLDADKLDGVQGSSFLRSDAADTASGSLTFTGTTAFGTTATFSSSATAINFDASSTSDNRGIAFNGRTALSADYNDNWLRLNNASEFSNGVYTPANFTVNGNLDVAQYIRHYGDTNTYIRFEGDTISLYCGGSRELTANTTGVRLGDTGNGYFQPVSGSYGSIQIDGGAHGGWEGYSIGGRSVFMHDNSTAQGIYNDVNNEWLFYGVSNADTRMYYNGASKVQTTSYGALVNGNVRSQSTAKVWTNFESIGTLGIRDSLNQSSVSDLGTGYYRSNFSSNTANNAYAVGGTSGGFLPNYGSRVVFPEAVATSSYAFRTQWQANQAYYDSDNNTIIIIGD